MLHIADRDAEGAIAEWMTAWFDLLGAGRLAEACAQLDPSPGSGRSWTPDTLLATLHDQFGPGTRFSREHPEGPTFSPASTALGHSHAEVMPYADGTGYAAQHDVPLNGTYSDLTAQFDLRRAGEHLRITLYDMKVL